MILSFLQIAIFIIFALSFGMFFELGRWIVQSSRTRIFKMRLHNRQKKAFKQFTSVKLGVPFDNEKSEEKEIYDSLFSGPENKSEINPEPVPEKVSEEKTELNQETENSEDDLKLY